VIVLLSSKDMVSIWRATASASSAHCRSSASLTASETWVVAVKKGSISPV
jgi:hypothetical protein